MYVVLTSWSLMYWSWKGAMATSFSTLADKFTLMEPDTKESVVLFSENQKHNLHT